MKNLTSTFKKYFSRKLPSVSFDVDGVLKKGNNQIPRSREAIINLKKRGVPVSLITNGGGELESVRGNKISEILKLEEKYKFKEKEVFLCHTPMKDLISQYKDKFILITGINRCDEVIESYGFSKYMTIFEYFSIFDQIVPLYSFISSQEQKNTIKQKVESRLGVNLNNHDLPQVHAIFIMTDVVNWEINAQVCSDLLISQQGIPGTYRKSHEKQFVDLHIGSDDLLYKDTFSIPRLAAGSFVKTVSTLIKEQYNIDILYNLYGKPGKSITRNNEELNLNNFYMIGDNPVVDIQGANSSNYISILVKSGVFNEGENSKDYPAKYVVNDAYEAVELILKLENIN